MLLCAVACISWDLNVFLVIGVTCLPDLYKTTVRTYDRLDIVCNSAGVGFERSLNGDMWFKTIDINLVSVMWSRVVDGGLVRCNTLVS